MRAFTLMILIILIGCNPSENKQNPNISTNKSTPKASNKQIPTKEDEITEGGIGNLLLDEPFASIDAKYKNVEPMKMQGNGSNWAPLAGD